MKIRTISYMIKQGFKGLWRNRVMSLASIASIASALVILGLVFMIVLNINSLADTTKNQFDSIQIYLKDDLGEKQIEEIGEIVKTLEGVNSIEYISRAAALEYMQNQWGEHGYLLEGLEKNPLPNSYIVNLNDISYANQVVTAVEEIEGLEEVRYYKDVVDRLMNITNIIRSTGMVVIGILIVISMFIVSNTIKLTVIARYREINIMKYVGATNWFIRWPFLVEGMVLGLLGSLIALAVVGFGYSRLFYMVTQQLYVMIASYMIIPNVVISNLSVIFIILGTGIGTLGSIFSMRRFLKV
ncbi:MAG: permease-like cell division protein FtsX [Alkaliphilus sp.]|nr:permease-like cell division protein FtsX [Alkaliphilus sp.]